MLILTKSVVLDYALEISIEPADEFNYRESDLLIAGIVQSKNLSLFSNGSALSRKP